MGMVGNRQIFLRDSLEKKKKAHDIFEEKKWESDFSESKVDRNLILSVLVNID